MSASQRAESKVKKGGLPSRRGCALLIVLALLIGAAPFAVWYGLPRLSHSMQMTNPAVADIEKTCHDAVALSLELAAPPPGYSSGTILPQEVRDSQAGRADQLLPDYFAGDLLQQQLRLYHDQLNQGNFVALAKLDAMHFKSVLVNGESATATGKVSFSQDVATPEQWTRNFTFSLVKQSGRWLITAMDMAA